MSGLTMAGWAGLFALSCAAALVVLWMVGAISLRTRHGNTASGPAHSHFLFDGTTLVDHDVTDLSQYGPGLDQIDTWSEFRDWLAPRFSRLPQDLNVLDAAQTFPSRDGSEPKEMTLEPIGERIRISLSQDAPPSPAAWHDALCRMEAEIRAHDILDSWPYPAWQTDDTGHIIWRNAASAGIVDDTGQLPEGSLASVTRFSVASDRSASPTWYEMQSLPTANGHVHFASDITQVIRAETVQREFIQTLTKTFANLTTGLAIFDRNRQLALFNPALLDLTNVPVTFLSARPGLIPFFDELRERQILPEPKNYATWRAQITDVVDQANDGFYHETWTLPTGQTYRVTGRPHPDGAIAFLFEDISAEITLTRRFRSQIDLSHAVLDRLDDAIAVIGPGNLLTFCNQACADLLKIDPDTSFADMTLQDLLVTCRDSFKPDACWKVFEQHLVSRPVDMTQPLNLTFTDGRMLEGRIKSLSGGGRMLIFRHQPANVFTAPSQSSAP